PYWRCPREEFVIASDSSTTRKTPGIELSFGYEAGPNQPEAILVDFSNGKAGYARVEPLEKGPVHIQDMQAVEVLLLEPDGRLSLLEAGDDIDDYERTQRVRAARASLAAVRKGGKD